LPDDAHVAAPIASVTIDRHERLRRIDAIA
jgi:hypothetical protein